MSSFRGVVFLFLASCAASTSAEEDAGSVAAPVVIPDTPRSISDASVLDEIDVTTTATTAPPDDAIPDTREPASGPVPDPWEPTRHTTNDGKKD